MLDLFSPNKIGVLPVKNHFVRSALWVALATEEGDFTPELEQVYIELAEGGVGTIQTGYARIRKDEAPNPKMIGAFDDRFIPQFQNFTKKIHEHGTKIIIQIAYGGSFTSFNTQKVWSPSGEKTERGIESTAISVDDIKELVQDYAEAARRAKEGGFDGVSVHSGHGYFLSQFLSPKYNKRTDMYGGSIENRSRIHQEIITAIREKVGDTFPIWMKINSQDFVDGGFTEDDMIQTVKLLHDMGLSAIDVSGGDEGAEHVANNNLGPARKNLFKEENQSYFQHTALRLAKETSCPIILSGGNRNLQTMMNLFKKGIEFFALGRPLTSEPNLIQLWQQEPDRKIKCVSCNMCYITVGKRCILNEGTLKEA